MSDIKYYLVFWRTTAKSFSSICKKKLTFSVKHNIDEIK